MLAAVCAGCAGLPAAPAADGRLRLARGELPEGAYLTDGALLLRYRIDGRPLALRAQWSLQDVAPGRATQLVAQLDVADEDPAQIERELAAAMPVRLVDGEQWRRLMTRVLLEVAPADERGAVLLAVQGRDVAVYREVDKLRVVSFADKPARLRIERVVSDEEFAARASRTVDEALGSSGPALIDVGADAFLLLDPARSLSVYVVRPPDAEAGGIGQPVGFALRTADALLLQSHVLAPLKSPFSTGYRLLWRTLHAGLALLPMGGVPTRVPHECRPQRRRLADWSHRRNLSVTGDSSPTRWPHQLCE